MDVRVNLNPENTWSYYLENEKIMSNKLNFTNGTINMFGYVRVSTQLQAQFGSSITTQIQLLINECSRQQYDETGKKIRYNLVRIYVDDGISAKNITDRYAFVSLKQHITSLVNGRSHKKLGILTPELSRLTRSSEDLEFILKWIKDNSIRLKFIDNSIDPESNSGKLMLSMMAGFFEFERKNSSFKTKLTLRSMSERGMLTGHCSYGWTNGIDEHGRKINVPVEDEQEGLQYILSIIKNSERLLTANEIKNHMNKTNILCMRGPGYINGQRTHMWNGLWTIKIIKKIQEHERFRSRQLLVGTSQNIIKKDEIVTSLIKDYLEEHDLYDDVSFNYSQIARMIDDTHTFNKEIRPDYVKTLMVSAKIISPKEIKSEITEEDIVLIINELLSENNVIGYSQLSNLMNDRQVPILGKRKSWTCQNVRLLCIKHNINVHQL